MGTQNKVSFNNAANDYGPYLSTNYPPKFHIDMRSVVNSRNRTYITRALMCFAVVGLLIKFSLLSAYRANVQLQDSSQSIE